MDIQPVFNEYKVITYMSPYLRRMRLQNEAAKEAFENSLSYYETMFIVRIYTSKRKCSVKEAVYHIFPELKL